MTLEWQGPPVPVRNRRAGIILRFGDQNDLDSTSTDSRLQFMQRRKHGLERLSVILDDFAAEHGLPFCTATTEVSP